MLHLLLAAALVTPQILGTSTSKNLHALHCASTLMVHRLEQQVANNRPDLDDVIHEIPNVTTVVKAFIPRGGKFIYLTRRSGDPFKGLYDPPGGTAKTYLGETIRQVIEREMMEELGATLTDIRYHGIKYVIDPHSGKIYQIIIVTADFATMPTGILKPNEIDLAAFFPFAKLPSETFQPALEAIRNAYPKLVPPTLEGAWSVEMDPEAN